MTKQELEQTIEQLQQELAAKDATIAELKASKSVKTRVAKQVKEKVVERSVQKLHNSDYIGRLLTKHTHEEVLATMSEIASFTELPMYVKVAGDVRVNGQYNYFTKLVPVTVSHDGVFTVLNTNNTVTPAASDTWDECWIAAMRPSATNRYFEGIKPEKKQ